MSPRLFARSQAVRAVLSCTLLAAPALYSPVALYAQAAPSGNTTQRGTVKTVSAHQPHHHHGRQRRTYTVTPSDGTRVLQLAPGSTDLKTAQPATAMADIAPGDRVLTTGKPGDTCRHRQNAVRIIPHEVG